MGRKHGFSFSWKRATGVSAMKGRIARKTGIPTTRGGRQRKVGRMVTGGGCLIALFQLAAMFAGTVAVVLWGIR
ncbi:hypothetical protein B7486_16520 [cyanobacterium TDX16]|nr:hypothetical protein B7486_16520 [cyanobacterium TDX16]